MPFETILPALVTGGIGISQLLMGAKLRRNLQRPEATISSYDLGSYNLAKYLSMLRTMPSQARLEQQILGSAASTIEAIKSVAPSSGNVLGAMTNIYEQQINKLADIQAKAAQFYINNQYRLMQESKNIGQLERRNWELNKYMPYREKAASASALTGAGLQNIVSSVDKLSTNLMLDKLLNDNKQKSSKSIISDAAKVAVGATGGVGGD